MKKNCVILIDCWNDFAYADNAISYIKQYKPMFVVNASYDVEFYAAIPGTTVTINSIGQAHGLFDFLGNFALPLNSRIKEHLNESNISVVDITLPEKFVEFATSKEISSVTVMGSSWHNCIHHRPLGINNLPKFLPENMRYLTYPMACAERAGEPVVTHQIKSDDDWVEVLNTDQQVWEFVRDRKLVVEHQPTIFVKES